MRWKPWHAIEEGDLVLRGVPVPLERAPAEAHASLLSRSFLVRALARYNGSLGKTVYPNKVFSALQKNWFKQ